MPAWEISPAQSFAAVTPSDVTVYAPPFRSLFIGGAGTVSVVGLNGVAATFTVVAGYTLKVAGTQVKATGTTATLIVGLY